MSRFRLRTLLIVVTLVAIYLANATRNAGLQKRFIEQVADVGGYARYDWQYTNLAFDPDAVPPQPQWLLRVVDKNYLMQVTHVRIPGDVSDAHLKWINNNRCLEGLDINVEKSEQLLQQIQKQGQLRSLRICADCELVLDCLQQMPNLEMLSIEGATLRDLAPVAKLPALKSLSIRGCDLTELDVRSFGDMKQLIYLDIVSGDYQHTLGNAKFFEISGYLPNCTFR